MTRIAMGSLLTLGVIGAVALATAASLPYQVVVDREGPEEEVFEEVTGALADETGADEDLIEEALEGFDSYIDRRIEKERKSVTLYPQTLFEVAKATVEKGWSGKDIGALLIHIQTEIDVENRSATKMKRIAVQAIEAGKPLEDVVEELEEGETEDDAPGGGR